MIKPLYRRISLTKLADRQSSYIHTHLSPFCTEAKKILQDAGANFKVIELGDEWVPGLLPAKGAAIRAELGAMTGQTSMPHVFIAGKSIGGLATGTPGLNELVKSGELRKRLSDAGALKL